MNLVWRKMYGMVPRGGIVVYIVDFWLVFFYLFSQTTPHSPSCWKKAPLAIGSSLGLVVLVHTCLELWYLARFVPWSLWSTIPNSGSNSQLTWNQPHIQMFTMSTVSFLQDAISVCEPSVHFSPYQSQQISKLQKRRVHWRDTNETLIDDFLLTCSRNHNYVRVNCSS